MGLNRFKKSILALAALMSMGCGGCSSLLYYPTRLKYVDQTKLRPVPEEVEFHLEDGTKLVGWYFDADKKKTPKTVILFFHGNAQNVSSHFLSLYWVLPYNIDFFVFDYPGYGGSEGDPTPKSTVKSGLAAVSWLRKRHPNLPVAVFGQSLGGAVALKTVIESGRELNPCLVTVESTFPSYRRAARRVMAQSWLTWVFQPLAYVLFSDRHAPHKQIDRISPVPLIVMHGDQDPVIDIELGREVYEQAAEPKEFWPIPEGTHIDGFSGVKKAEFQRRYLAALDQHCF